jgi:predicted DNA-binding protein YlxM (UPF0122 family)
LINYLKGRAKKLKVFTSEFNAAFIVTAIFVIGTLFMVPPFSWVMALNEHFKDSASVKYGEPPYGHAELSSLKSFTEKMRLDLDKSEELLKQAGYPVENSAASLQTIANRYKVAPQQLYDKIKVAAIAPDPRKGNKAALPESPPPGTGTLKLADLCTQYDLSIQLVIRELKEKGITVSADSTLKEIAAQNKKSPVEVYDLIRSIGKND